MRNINRRQALKTGLAGAVGLALPFSVNAKQEKITLADENIFNPFIRPNVIKENYYGSGDVNNDGKINLDDYELMQIGRENDYSDIDGDGERSTQNDLGLLEQHLNNRIILPGDWENLQIREQKEDWLGKMLKIDDTDEHEWIENVYDCTQFTSQSYINFRGFKKTDPRENDIPKIYDVSKNGRFNLPVYFVSISEPAHACNAILVGDSPLNFEDWCFIEPRTAYKNMNLYYWLEYYGLDKIDVKICSLSYFIDSSPVVKPLIKFEVIKDNYRVVEYDDDLVLERPTSYVGEDRDKPVGFSLEQNYPNPFNASTSIEYILSKPGEVELSIYNIVGQKLETLVDDYKSVGKHSVKWNAGNNASGIYLYELTSGNSKESKKMLLLK